MDDYISRENITERLERVIEHGVPNTMGTHSITAEATLEVIREIPAADVAPVRHGRWIDRPSKRGYGMSTYCSCCGQHSGIGGIKSNRHRAYCPNCGAKMHRGQDDV